MNFVFKLVILFGFAFPVVSLILGLITWGKESVK